MTIVAQAIKQVTIYSASFTFSFSFRLLDEADLVVLHIDQSTPVVVRTLVLTTDYLVSAAPWPTGGTITIEASDQGNWTSGDTVVVYRRSELKQQTDYIENDPFPAETHEQTVDISRMIEQELDELLVRAMAYPIDAAIGSNFDARTKLIQNVVDPVDDQDAATKNWVNITFISLPQVLAGPAGPQSPVIPFSESGTFTGTLSGMTATVDGTFRWHRSGTIITISKALALIGTSNAVTMQLSGIPVAIRPTNKQMVLCCQLVNDGNDDIFGRGEVQTGGIIVFTNLVGVAGPGPDYLQAAQPFENTGDKGTFDDFTISYDMEA